MEAQAAAGVVAYIQAFRSDGRASDSGYPADRDPDYKRVWPPKKHCAQPDRLTLKVIKKINSFSNNLKAWYSFVWKPASHNHEPQNSNRRAGCTSDHNIVNSAKARCWIRNRLTEEVSPMDRALHYIITIRTSNAARRELPRAQMTTNRGYAVLVTTASRLQKSYFVSLSHNALVETKDYETAPIATAHWYSIIRTSGSRWGHQHRSARCFLGG